MSARLVASIEASALIRRIAAKGGNAAVLAKGDPGAGAILLVMRDRGGFTSILERALAPDLRYSWREKPAQDIGDEGKLAQFIERRRQIDPDLWVIELDIAGVERLAAELIAEG